MLYQVDIKSFPVPFGAKRTGGGYNVIMPAKRSNPKTMHRAGELRKELIPAEKKLWAYLRGDKLNRVSFRRQHAIGNFIPDFVSIKKKLIIELDGSQHLEQAEYDVERSKYFESLGYKVIRFWNSQVENDINGVIRAIELNLMDNDPSNEIRYNWLT
jgi:very-short-patch-repair endonuclease